MRSEELRDKLWAVCDRKSEEAQAERAKLMADSYVTDHTALLAQYFTGLLQVEVDRWVMPCGWLKLCSVPA